MGGVVMGIRRSRCASLGHVNWDLIHLRPRAIYLNNNNHFAGSFPTTRKC